MPNGVRYESGDDLRILVLPGPDHNPPAGLKLGRELDVSGLIPLDFRPPPSSVCLR